MPLKIWFFKRKTQTQINLVNRSGMLSGQAANKLLQHYNDWTLVHVELKARHQLRQYHLMLPLQQHLVLRVEAQSASFGMLCGNCWLRDEEEQVDMDSRFVRKKAQLLNHWMINVTIESLYYWTADDFLKQLWVGELGAYSAQRMHSILVSSCPG